MSIMVPSEKLFYENLFNLFLVFLNPVIGAKRNRKTADIIASCMLALVFQTQGIKQTTEEQRDGFYYQNKTPIAIAIFFIVNLRIQNHMPSWRLSRTKIEPRVTKPKTDLNLHSQT